MPDSPTAAERCRVELDWQKGKLQELTSLWEQFESRKGKLLGAFDNISERVSHSRAPESSIIVLKNLSGQLQDLEKELNAMNNESDQLRELSHRISASDSGHAIAAQEALAEIDMAQETTHSAIAERLQVITSLISQWQSYLDSKVAVVRILDNTKSPLEDVEPLDSQVRL